MNCELHLRDPLGERTVAAHELPLGIGGEGAAVAVPGVERNRLAAVFGQDEHGFYIERAEDSLTSAPAPRGKRESNVRLNGQPVIERTGLSHADVLTVGDARIFFLLDGSRALLKIEHAAGNATAPPPVQAEGNDADIEAQGDIQSIHRAAFKPSIGLHAATGRRLRPIRWALAAGIGVLALALWTLTTASSVRVVSDPQDVRVDFSGAWLELGFGGNYLLRPGAYTLVASKPGFETARQPVRITGEPNQQLQVSLKKLPGKVHIDTGSVTATALVDGKEVGRTPGEFILAAGARQVTLKAPRHLDWNESIEVQGAGRQQALKARLIPAFSAVTIESRPAGARVAVDNKELGVTPLTTELDAGTYTLSLSAPGRRRWESNIQVSAGQPQKIGPIQLGLPDGKLLVRTIPAGADISIAGRYRGRAPLEANLAPGIQYAIDINRAGYAAARRVVPIKAAENATLQIELKPILGQVTVRGEPADAQLFVEGEARGAANQTLGLPSTELKLEIRREGYQTFATTVTPQPGFARLVEYKLLTPDQVRAARVPPVIKTSVGGELRLIPTGRYEMGSARREAGSRSNETRRAVVLQRSFYLGVREVTNAEFLRFRSEHLSGIVKNRSLDQDNHPVVNVGWQDAAEFCNWLSAQDGLPAAYELKGETYTPVTPATIGYRLPTEAEWEWAARYERGQPSRSYPWGTSLPVPPRVENYADKSALVVLESALEGYEDGVPTTAPVGRSRPTALGLYDIGGNVSEWMQDLYTVDRGLIATPATDPSGPQTGNGHVIRGASWKTSSVTELRIAWRDSFDGKAQHVGFRIARYAE